MLRFRHRPIAPTALVWLAAAICGSFITSTVAAIAADAQTSDAQRQVQRWGVFEIELKGPADGNPFVDVQLSAEFQTKGSPKPRTIHTAGFYDGDGVYRIRFMPDELGTWSYSTSSNCSALGGQRGEFTAVVPAENNRGPVRVQNTYHFAYADGTPYSPFGTTCYAWIHQPDELQEQTLKTLADSPFNKLRMCVFPKWYSHNHREPALYPFEKLPAAGGANDKSANDKSESPNRWDFARFNPEYFQHLEKRVSQLGELGIEADLIIFHPYDGGHWGFDQMPPEADDRYLRYLIARLAAYRNVWWSLANEYDLLKAKQPADWDRFFSIVAHDDPYGHLRSIHNCREIYNNTNPLVTHASIQNGSAVEDVGRAEILRDVYRKPIVYDEVKYEGNLPQRWGNLSAEELVHRFWNATIAGTYATHGETYLNADDIIWWSHGGVLHGNSPARIAFLRKIVEAGPATGIDLIDKWQDLHTAGKVGEYYLIYFGKERPTDWAFKLPAAKQAGPANFRVEIIDAWNMTITPLDRIFHCTLDADNTHYTCSDMPNIELPGKPYLALRISRVRDLEQTH